MNRGEIARLLRQARGRIAPVDVGLPAGERRRVPGLRREEVAALAGLSVDYVVRLEQGRGPRPSRSVLLALSRALRLSDTERDQLFALAEIALPRAGEVDMVVRPSVQRLMDRLADVPVILLSAKADVLAWNAMAAALLGDFSAIPLRERNIIWQRFLGDRLPVATTEAERAATDVQTTASLRMAAGRYPDDADLRALVTDLRRRSPSFAALWDAATPSAWSSRDKTVHHRELGLITLDCDALHLPESDQVLLVYSAPPGSPAAQTLALLRVLGTQSMV